MVADTYTPRLGLIEQGTGNNNNTWGTIFNASFALIAERAMSGVNTITSTGGTVDLSGSPPPAGPRADIDMIQLANGVLTSDLTIIVPNLSKLWWFENATGGAFNTYVKVPGGTSPLGLVQIPQGCVVLVMCDGTNLFRQDRAQVGNAVSHFGATVPSGTLQCNGASLLRTEFPDLFTAIGTTWGAADGTHFTLPLTTDTGRFLRSSTGSLTVGTYQANGNAAHTHTGSGTTSGQSANHSHTFSGSTGGMSGADPHTHSISGGVYGSSALNLNYANSGIQGGAPAAVTPGNTSVNHTHAYSGTTSGFSADHTHSYSFTTSGGSADTSGEARPESAVVLMCIRY